ncbi:dermonecrotic toxin domain-containing protein [Pseudomonas sp. MDT2-39-1]
MSNNTSSPQTESTPLVETSDLVSLTSHGPMLSEVASNLLRQMLEKSWPELQVDPDKAFVATPRWLIVDDHVEAGPTEFESLTLALMRQGLYGTVANYLEGEHFLTLEPDSENPVHLAVSIEDIARILNDSASILFVEAQVRQLEFWNAKGHVIPRWQELSDTLRKALNVQTVKGWDADECAMAREVFNAPDKTTRKNVKSEFSAIQACLLDVDTVENDIARHLLIGGALVLKATYRKRELLVMYTIERAYESFSSLEELGSSLPARLEEQQSGRGLTWRLYEPEGNVFDHMAWALVSSQLDAINSLQFLEAPAVDVEPETGLDPTEKAQLLQLNKAIPDWLRNASYNDVQDYSRYISALGKLYRQPNSKLAKAEIPSITDYAQQLMREAIIADPLAVGSANLALDDLRIKITNSFSADNFTLPNPLDQRIETLADFALENEAPYMATLFFKGGEAVPDWLTAELLTTVSARVDVGKAYPELIKPKLLEDPVASRRQENFYRDQLRSLLPLQALEARFKPETGVDERGYQYVCELLDPDVSAKTIALYPLTMTPQHRLINSSDTVDNMFIISPREAHGGPCLLYRPMLDEPLLQYPSRQNLLYALHQPGDLRDSVLAWLPGKNLSFEYAQYVFPTGLPSPWLIAEQVVNPLQRADKFGRVVFESVEITGDILSALFKSNAQMLVNLADRKSRSNAERRWSVLKDSGWALFNVASNFLSGAVGTAVWVWQTINQIQQALDAHDKDDRFIEWTSVSDILLAIGIILSHHAVMRRKRVSSKPRIEQVSKEKAAKLVAEPVTVTLNPTPLAPDLPPNHLSSLELAGSVPRRAPTALGAYLDTLKVTAPDISSASVTKVKEAPPHFYQHKLRNYAQVGDRWFYVDVKGDEEVHIVYPDQPERNGPMLMDNGKGQWVLDLRLRLRGGAGNAFSRHQEAANEQRRVNLGEALRSFKSLEKAKETELTKLHDGIRQASAENYDQRTAAYMEKLDATIGEYRRALEQLREWRTLGGTENYREDLLRMSVVLQKNLSLWFVLKRSEYAQATSVMTKAGQNEPVPRQTFVDSAQKASDLGQEMSEKLTLSALTLEGMHAAGRPGIERAMEIKKLAPSFTVLDIKANEIGMAQELCLNEQASPLMQQARTAVANIVVSAAKAAIQVADLMKVEGEHSGVKEHVEDLNSLVETFADADQRIQELPGTYAGLVKPSKLEHLQSLIDEFSQLAHNRLQALLPEPIAVQPPVERVQPGTSRQPIKVRKTRPRDSSKNETEKTTEDPLKPFTPAVYKQPVPVLDDAETVEAGIELDLDTNTFIERTRKDALLPRRIPADIQDVFDQQALKLEQAASSVDQAVANSRKAGGDPIPVATLSRDLRDGASRLRKEGVSVRADLYTRRKPTQSIFKWMHENGQLDISRDKRGRIQTKGLGDLFQEYRIFDKPQNKPLWVAHFHYETLTSPANAPTAAHLKVSDDYLKTLTPELQQALTTFEPIDGVFRKIEDPGLRKLFLDLEPQAKTAS